MSSTQRKTGGASREVLDWLVRVAAPLLGVIGALLYGVLRLAYLFFYLQLRATPEDVGYGYSEILATQLVGAFELVLLLAVLIVGVRLGVRAVHAVARRRRREGLREGVRRVLRTSVVAAVVTVVAGLPCLAWLMGAEAAKGYAVRNVYPRGFIAIPILAVQAVPARVESVSGPEAGLGDIESRACLLYLGSHEGTAVFYDVDSEESIRVPSSSVTVVLPFTNRVPHGC
jgi:hypothetical protein